MQRRRAVRTLKLEFLFSIAEFLEPWQFVAFIASKLSDVRAEINLNLNFDLDKNELKFNCLCERQGV